MPVAVVRPSCLRGSLALPPSKSHTMRSIALAAMAHGTSTIYEPLLSPDTEAMIRVITALGACVEHAPASLCVKGIGGAFGSLFQPSVDVGNSGLALRFGTALCSLCRDPIVITGDSSIRTSRPLGALVHALQQLGLEASYLGTPGFAPLRMQGPIHSGSCVVDGHDSQPVSALLLTLPFIRGSSLIRVEEMGERPWLAMTLSALRSLGVSIEQRQDSVFSIPGNQRISGFSRCIPKDASSLAFPLVAGLMTDSEVQIHGVPFNDVQHDIVIIDYVRRMGGVVDCAGDCLTVRGPQDLHGIDIDINEAVDALPILAVLATKAHGKTRLFNGAVCRQKESDRIHVMAETLQQMGASITEHADGLTIYESPLRGASVSCCADHRIAMALSVAALSADGMTVVHGVECVAKSFSQFFSTLRALGGDVEVAS